MQKKNAEKRELVREQKKTERERIEKFKREDPKLYIEQLKDRRLTLKKKIKRIKLFEEDSNLKRQKEIRMMENLE